MIQSYTEEHGMPEHKIKIQFVLKNFKYEIIAASFKFSISQTEEQRFHSIVEVYKENYTGNNLTPIITEFDERILDWNQLLEKVSNISTNKLQWLGVQS